MVFFILYFLILIGISCIDLLPAFADARESALMIQYAVYCALIIFWSVSAGRRITNRPIRRIQKIIVFCFVLIMFFGRLRVVAFAGVYPLEHYLWYMYYIPHLLIPLLSYYAALYVGEDESYCLPDRAKLLLIPYVVILCLVLTNEWHQLAFRLEDPGTAISIEGRYHLAPFYFVAQIWLFGLAILAVITLSRKLAANNLRTNVLPFISMLTIGFIYTILYAVDRSPTGYGFIESEVMTCFPTMGLWELCIRMRLIPSNSGYNKWFRACTVPMEMLDRNGKTRFASKGISEEKDEKAPDGRSRTFITRTYEVGGGSLRWREDVTRFREVIAKLEENAALLAASNEKLSAQSRMKMQAVKARENAKLYDKALGETGDRLERIRTLLMPFKGDALNEGDEARLRDTLGRISVLGAYVKRRSNLVLLADKSSSLPLAELHFCLRESNEALVLVPVSTIYNNEADDTLMLEASDIMRVYDSFEKETEAVLDDLEYLRMTLKTGEGPALLRLRFGGERLEEKDIQIFFAPERRAE